MNTRKDKKLVITDYDGTEIEIAVSSLDDAREKKALAEQSDYKYAIFEYQEIL